MSMVNTSKTRITQFAMNIYGKLSASSPEERKMGEECDGFERLQEIISKVIAENHPQESMEDTAQLTIEGLLTLL